MFVVHVCYLSTGEAKAGGLLRVIYTELKAA